MADMDALAPEGKRLKSADQGSVAKPPTNSVVKPVPWEIRPYEVQPDESLIEKTHDRPMPLPFAIELNQHTPWWTRGKYVGHGQSKIAFLLENKTEVWKLSHLEDQEPWVCRELR